MENKTNISPGRIEPVTGTPDLVDGLLVRIVGMGVGISVGMRVGVGLMVAEGVAVNERGSLPLAASTMKLRLIVFSKPAASW